MLALGNVQHGPREGTPLMCEFLGIDPPVEVLEVLVTSFAEVGREAPLQLAPNAEACLRTLKDAGVRIGIICDVGMTYSPTLRARLEDFGVLELFDHWSFSDEVGCFKPFPAVFEHALAGLGVDDPSRTRACRRRQAHGHGRCDGDGHDRRPVHPLQRPRRTPARKATTSWTTTRSFRRRSG